MPIEVKLPELNALSDVDAMQILAKYIDQAADLKSPEMAKNALALCDGLEPSIKGILATELSYFKANAWSVIRISKHHNDSGIWHWDQPEILQEIYWLRLAIRSDCFSKLTPFRQCQILVNTGNILNHIGRPIEAIEYWKRALTITPSFAMAFINLGLGLEIYAKQLYDIGQAATILKQAHRLLKRVSDNHNIWDSYEFEQVKKQALHEAALISEHINLDAVHDIFSKNYSLGRSNKEKQYRKWVLDNCLYLNPLNDLGPHTIAAHDILHLPDMTTDVDEFPYLYGFYNQLKQEYASARYTLWQGLTGANPYKKHFSDKEVLLFNTLDYPTYGLAIEQIKFAFRSSYSIFDKIAFFINDYWQLNIPESKVNFQSVWFKFIDKRKTTELNEIFKSHPNLTLRGLYWLSKDFIESDDANSIALGKAMEPDANKLRSIRNHLEHKYIKIHDELRPKLSHDLNRSFVDNFAYHLTLNDLSTKTLRLLKLARAALIYLSLAVHQEEKTKSRDAPNFTIPIDLTILI